MTAGYICRPSVPTCTDTNSGVPPGTYERFYGVFRRESSHEQCQLAIGCHLDWSRIHSLHVFRSASATSVYLHDKLDIFMSSSLTQAKRRFTSLKSNTPQ